MISLQNSLPIDLILKIASSLEVSDLCSLGSCSRFWEELCRSDCVWKALYTERWPAIAFHQDSMGWKEMYVSKHSEMVVNAAFIINFVEQRLAFDSIEIAYHLKAVKYLHSMRFEFKDIQMMFLKPNVDVLVNWISITASRGLMFLPLFSWKLCKSAGFQTGKSVSSGGSLAGGSMASGFVMSSVQELSPWKTWDWLRKMKFFVWFIGALFTRFYGLWFAARNPTAHRGIVHKIHGQK